MQVESVQSTLRLLIDRAGEASPGTSLLTAILAGSLVWFVIHRRSRSTTMPKSSNFKDSEFDLPDLVNLECQSVVDPETLERLPQLCPDGSQLMTHLYSDGQTMLEAFERGCSLKASSNCLGRIELDKRSVSWLSYETVLKRIQNFGNGLYRTLGEESYRSRHEPPCVGIFATNCAEYVIAEYGCYWHSLVVVPIYDTLGPNVCSYIANQAEVECIICDKLERFQVILSQASSLKALRYIIVFNDLPQSYKLKALGFGIKVFTIEEIEEIGKKEPIEPHKPKPEDLAVICYTSGTTSVPKGVMLTHLNVIANVSAVMFQMLEHTIRGDDIMLSYLPLAHMFERCCENALYMVGGSVVFFSGDVRFLVEDMKIAKPTLIPAVPRLLTRIFCKIHDSVKSNVVKNFLLNTAYYFKHRAMEKKSGLMKNNTIWDKIVFNKVREGLGGRLRLIMCGSAPLNPTVLEFLRCALGCVILEGYGQTECVAPCTVTLPGDNKIGHVGGPIASAMIKLVDVPEMGYFAKEGRGEILVKGTIVFQGYFKNPVLTQQTLDTDGWLHTGDIGAFTENETLCIIDRKKNIFKLSQGEYIAPEKIENIYSQSSMVAQIFVYGESLKSSLVAIMVPDQVMLEMWCNNNRISGSFEEMCANRVVQSAMLKELQALGQKEGLKSFEQVKAIHLHNRLFSVDEGLITPTFKYKRNEILKQFKREITLLYQSVE